MFRILTAIGHMAGGRITLNQWGLIGLFVLLAGLGGLSARKRHITAS